MTRCRVSKGLNNSRDYLRLSTHNAEQILISIQNQNKTTMFTYSNVLKDVKNKYIKPEGIIYINNNAFLLEVSISDNENWPKCNLGNIGFGRRRERERAQRYVSFKQRHTHVCQEHNVLVRVRK